MSGHLLSVAAHGSANDWWLELGLPLVALFVLYFWSQRGERKRRADLGSSFAQLGDEDLRARIIALGEQAVTPTEKELVMQLREELARRERERGVVG